MLSNCEYAGIRATCTPVYTITDAEEGRKWEIFHQPNGRYCYIYSEYFAALGWRDTTSETNCTPDVIAEEFEISV